MEFNFENIKYLLLQSVKEWQSDKVSRLAAAMSYYTVFSIPPLIIIAIAISGYFFDRSRAQESILEQINSLMGESAGTVVEEILTTAEANPEGGLIASLISFVTLLLGASGVFAQLHESLNNIWEVESKAAGLWGTIKDRFFSFTMVLGVGFLLLVSLILSSFLSGLDSILTDLMPSLLILARILNFAVSFAVVTGLFALIYKIVPDVEVAWKDVFIGAVVTALLFTLGKWAIGLYLGNSAPGSMFGAFGSLIVLFIWVYYSSQILFFGAEFTQVYANKFGSRITADESAVPLTEEARLNQGMPKPETLAHREAFATADQSPALTPVQAPARPLSPPRTPLRARDPNRNETLHKGMRSFTDSVIQVLAVGVALWKWARREENSPS